MSDAVSTSKLDVNTTVASVPVRAQREVSYEFDTRATNADLAIPYVVIVNGKVQAPDKPRKLGKKERTIKVTVNIDSKVALHLNSDVHPEYRRNPVYEVEVADNDVMVKITEKTGRTHNARPVVGKVLSRQTKANGRSVDYYEALLTGDIWMAISHKYTEAEANALLPNDVEPVVRAAVCSIYRGLGVGKLDIPLSDNSGMMYVSFIKQDNPHNNITRCSLLADVLPRTHPCAFAAVFSGARKLGITAIHITSCWRPSLGAIPHRAGLGLDIDFLANVEQNVRVNRIGEKKNSEEKRSRR